MSDQPKSSSGGWRIPLFGKATGRSAIRAKDANDLVIPVNALGNITIIRTERSYDEVIYSDANVIIALKKETQPPNVEGSITIEEVDGTPSIANVTTLKFPNGTVTNPATGIAQVTFGSLTIEEADGSPTISFTKLVVPNGTLTDNGGGEAELTFGSGGGTVKMYRLKTVNGDTLTCREWDGTTEGGTDITIKKNMKLRTSIATATIDGVTVSYTYSSNVARVASIASLSLSENQVVTPRYLVNDIIYAAPVTNDSNALIDLNVDGRAWTRST